MTVMLRKPSPDGVVWSSMPGWGIVADLTPPELVASRSLKTLRRVIAGLLALVIVLCGAGVYYAHSKENSANDTLAAASDRTNSLTAQRARYAKVTQIEAAVSTGKGQQTSVMSTDVDLMKLTIAIAKATPTAVDPTSVSISLNGTTTAAGSATVGADSEVTVGAVTMTGHAKKINDLADYVARLSGTPGFVDVIPATNVRTSATKTAWTLTFQLTDAWYSKRFGAAAQTGTGASTDQTPALAATTSTPPSTGSTADTTSTATGGS